MRLKIGTVVLAVSAGLLVAGCGDDDEATSTTTTTAGEPEEGADELETFLDDAQAALDEVEQDPAALTDRNSGEDPFADVETQARELGLTECAN